MKRKASTAINRPFKRPRQVAPSKKKASVSLAAEKKFNDTSSLTDATTTAVLVNLNAMAAGDTALLRDGNKILSKSIQIRGTIRNESATISTVVRVMVVYDKNSNGTQPTAVQILEGIPGVTSLKSVANASRFITLMDKTYVTNSNGSFNYNYINEYVKVPQNCQLAAFADGTAAVPVSGSLTLLYIGSESTGVADTDIVFQMRCRFVG